MKSLGRPYLLSGIFIHHTAAWLLLFSTTIHRAHAIWLYAWCLNGTFSIFPSLLIPSYVLNLQGSLPVSCTLSFSMRSAAPFRFHFFGPDSWVYLPCRSLFFKEYRVPLSAYEFEMPEAWTKNSKCKEASADQNDDPRGTGDMEPTSKGRFFGLYGWRLNFQILLNTLTAHNHPRSTTLHSKPWITDTVERLLISPGIGVRKNHHSHVLVRSKKIPRNVWWYDGHHARQTSYIRGGANKYQW